MRVDPRVIKLNRRRVISLAGAAGLSSVLAGCRGSGSGATKTPVTPQSPTATATVTSTETPVLTATATQETISTPVPGYTDPQKWAGRGLTIAAWGGDYQDAQKRAFFDPFSHDTNASIQLKIADTARMMDQVDQGSVSWDAITFPMEEVLSLARANYLEPIDYAVIDKTPLFPEIALQYGVGADFFSTVIVYPPGSDQVPQSWVDFWDVPPLVPGQEPDPMTLRALRHHPVGTLEFALLADGVEMANLYPLDIERAFQSLNKIRDHVTVWYEDGKQPVELVIAGQVGMASAWNVRPWQLGVGDQVRFEWYGGMLSADAWVVPRGAPNKDVAMDFINYATRAVPSANFGRLVPFGPVNTDSLALLRTSRAEMLPTSPVNRSVQFFQNWNWWADNLDLITDQFEDWLLTEPAPSGTPASG
jgi:putative spermidine/putrescine transport system substrate-binding protein